MNDINSILSQVFEFVIMIVGIGCATGVITSFFKYRSGKANRSPELMAKLDDLTERIARLDNAVDSVAVEVERISEAQRFTSKLLAERAGTPSLPERGRSGGSTTPH